MITQLLKLRKLKYSQVSVKEELNYLIESYNPKILKNNLINYVNQTPANTLKQSNNSTQPNNNCFYILKAVIKAWKNIGLNIIRGGCN